MESNQSTPGFFARVSLALRVIVDAELARRCVAPAPVVSAPSVATKPAALPAERQHASALLLLGMLQREGRLVDFLQQDVAAFADDEVGAAARVVHEGCRKVLMQTLTLAPVLNDAEGASVNVPKGFDAQRIRLTGNITGEPPYQGALKHHGWLAQEVKFPAVQDSIDPRVIAPAEVEL